MTNFIRLCLIYSFMTIYECLPITTPSVLNKLLSLPNTSIGAYEGNLGLFDSKLNAFKQLGPLIHLKSLSINNCVTPTVLYKITSLRLLMRRTTILGVRRLLRLYHQLKKLERFDWLMSSTFFLYF